MAQRYGGKFSPTDIPGVSQPGRDTPPSSGSGWSGKRRTRAGGRVNALFLAPVPLVLLAFGKEPIGLALNLAAFGILMAAAFLTREGLIAHEAYDARKVARRPALPRKLLGSALTGMGLAVAGAASGSVLTPVIFGVLGTGLHFLSFGPDPLRNKLAQGDAHQSGRVARAVEEAEQHLSAMTSAIAQTGDRALIARVAEFQTTARRMFRTVEEDPRDLSSARRYLGVYLLGARDATVKYADHVARANDATARAEYTALLDDLEQGFAARTEKMLTDSRDDLDIEIEVLRDRLARDGISNGPPPDTH